MAFPTALRRALPRIVSIVGISFGAAAATTEFGSATGEEAVARFLATRGLSARAQDVRATVGPGGVGRALTHEPYLALAARPGRGRDVYYLEARVSPNGRLLSARRLTNLSRSPAADETDLESSGPRAAFATRTESGYEAVTLLDLRGEPSRLTAGWSPLWRAAISVTRFQETGRADGIGRTRVGLRMPAAALRIHLDAKDLVLDIPEGRVALRGDRLLSGASFVHMQNATRGQPGLLGWAVDTVRSEIGPGPVERLEHVFFQAQDLGRRAYYGVRGAETAEEIGRELGMPSAARAHHSAAPPPELGFPPPPADPVLRTRLEGEGEWVPVEDDFVRGQPGLGPVFYTTWLRVDPERTFARVVMTIWDPRQVALGLRAGTTEPVGDRGQAGDGMIPRDRRLLGRLVAGFNGGFQALHGEYGVMVDDEVLLPPKPWAATIAILSGGRLGFGTWPNGAEVPEEIDAFRQNMTVLVQDGELDPYHRSWWGGAPPGAEDPAHTIRTAVCLTKEGFGLYAWGKSISHETLAAALIAARCGYAVHLDMNSGHSGFEFYRVAETKDLPPLERPLERGQEAEGEVRGIPGLAFRSRRMVRGMGHMRFPRYIGRDPRDFFYLTLRPILPGEPLLLGRAARAQGEGVFSVAGLPHRGFPYALARTFVVGGRPDARVAVVRMDPQRIALAQETGATKIARLSGVDGMGTLALVARPGDVGPVFAVTPASAAPGAIVLRGNPLGQSPARAAVGVDPDGRLVWAEGGDTAGLAEAMRLAEVSAAIGLGGPDAHLELVHPTGAARLDGGAQTPSRGTTTEIFGVDRPLSMRLFPDVEVVPPRVWHPLQSKRVRYFREPADAGAAPTTDDADAGPQ